MTELISKQAAINTTFNMCCRWDGEDRDDLRNMMLTAFQELPTIDPVKHGEWLNTTTDITNLLMNVCSECGFQYPSAIRPRFNYCPNCGTRMNL